MTRFGQVTVTDLADEVLQRAAMRSPRVNFVAGDLFEVDLPLGSFDVAVSLEVLSHVADQQAFVHRVASLLKPGGVVLLATQNRAVLERWSQVGPPAPGQLRRWVDARQLRQLLSSHFDQIEIGSVLPVGDQGWLRLLNSHKLNRLLARLVPADRIQTAKERALLGHTLMARAVRVAGDC